MSIGSSMDRSFSVEDLGGLWSRLGTSAGSQLNLGFPRTDSEAAFQEFLKRIPSTSNLAAAAQQLDQQQQQQQQSSIIAAGSLNDLNTNGIHGLSNSQHMPRVPSLDFLRQLVTNQHNFVIAPTIPPGNLGLKSELPDSSIMPILPGPSALSLPHLHSNDMGSGHHHPSSSGPAHEATHHALSSGAGPMNPAAAAAAALHLGQLSRYTTQASAQHSPSASPPQNEPVEKTEIRRARRMLSNRESARRSRRRKQEHLMTLEEQIAALEEQKKAIADQASAVERRINNLEDDNKRLREEGERLREELRFFRPDPTDRAGSKLERGYSQSQLLNRPNGDAAEETGQKRPRSDGRA